MESGMNNFDFKTQGVCSLIENAFEHVTKQNWCNCVAHVREKTNRVFFADPRIATAGNSALHSRFYTAFSACLAL